MTRTRRPWLAQRCRRHTIPNDSREWMRRVQRVEAALSVWSVATDGKALVAVADGGVMAEGGPTWTSATEAQRAATVAFITKAATWAMDWEFEPADLRQWLGPMNRVPCPDCTRDGVRWVDPAEWVCGECDGLGRVWPALRQCVRLGTRDGPRRWLEPDELRKALPRRLSPWGTPASGCTATLPAEKLAALHYALFRGRGWVSCVAGLGGRGDGSGRTDYDTAPRYVPGLGAVWHWRTERRYVLADWLEERGEDIEEVEALPF